MIEQYKDLASTKIDDVKKHLNLEYNNISSGGAHPSLLSNVKVNYYGDLQPLQNVSNIQAKDFETLSVTVYEATFVTEIAKSISKTLPHLNPVVDDNVIKIHIPQQTAERRAELVKETKKILEESKIKIRNVRKDVFNKIKANKELSENESELFQDELQKLFDKANKELEQIQKDKETKLLKV